MANVKRYGMVIGIKKEKINEYKQLHSAVWKGVLDKIKECHIQNYSIYLREIEKDKFYLFSYFEYTGKDFQADMKKMAEDPLTQKWWSVCKPCQDPLKDQWWADMKEVFHVD